MLLILLLLLHLVRLLLFLRAYGCCSAYCCRSEPTANMRKHALSLSLSLPLCMCVQTHIRACARTYAHVRIENGCQRHAQESHKQA